VRGLLAPIESASIAETRYVRFPTAGFIVTTSGMPSEFMSSTYVESLGRTALSCPARGVGENVGKAGRYP